MNASIKMHTYGVSDPGTSIVATKARNTTNKKKRELIICILEEFEENIAYNDEDLDA